MANPRADRRLERWQLAHRPPRSYRRLLVLVLASLAALRLGGRSRAFSALRLVTFDLDDTLWPQDPVVGRANAAMAEESRRVGAASIGADDVAAEMRAIRHSLPTKISYSELRRQGIAKVFERAGSTPSSADALAASIFEAWLRARHDAAEDLLFEGVVGALASIRSDHPDAVVGAITNSRVNPFAVPSLAPLFDFTVSGEDANIFLHRKPSPVIFEFALERAASLSGKWAASDLRGNSWVHVGDDLPNDVGAAADAGARSVWIADDGAAVGTTEGRSYSTATPEEQAKRLHAAQVARDKMAARIRSVVELPQLFRDWIVESAGND